MNVFGRIFLNSRKDRRKDVKTEFFLWDVEELTFLISKIHMSHLWIVKDIKTQIICCVGDSIIYQSKISKQIKKFENNMKSTVYPVPTLS